MSKYSTGQRKKLFRRRVANRSVGGDAVNVIILTLFAAFMALPLVYTVGNAFKPLDELWYFPPRFLPRNWTLQNFKDLLILMSGSWVPITRYLFNTVFITAVGTTGHILLASMAAYVLEKHEFPGRRLFFTVVTLSLMITTSVTAIVNYLTIYKLGLLDSQWSIILPAIGGSLGLYLMKNFMGGIPDSFIEAARIEGASELHIFFKIAMPLVKPAWLTLLILCVQNLWNSTGGTYIYSEQLKTLPYAMSQIMAGGVARQGVAGAVSVLMMVVPITTFIITQSNVLETMVSAGIKE